MDNHSGIEEFRKSLLLYKLFTSSAPGEIEYDEDQVRVTMQVRTNSSPSPVILLVQVKMIEAQRAT